MLEELEPGALVVVVQVQTLAPCLQLQETQTWAVAVAAVGLLIRQFLDLLAPEVQDLLSSKYLQAKTKLQYFLTHQHGLFQRV
jgi:hypothetical protein